VGEELRAGQHQMSHSPEPGSPWSAVFSRSRLAPVVFNVRDPYWDELIEVASQVGLPTVTWVSMFSPYYSSTPMLDGMIIRVGTYGWYHPLPSGTRVVGFKPFRLLCVLLKLRQPRRLKSEPPLLSEEELRSELKRQASLPLEILQTRSTLGLGVSDRFELLKLVADLYGESALPPLSEVALEQVRAVKLLG
jgi:hypothetical protein